jgi:hypothetical protein
MFRKTMDPRSLRAQIHHTIFAFAGFYMGWLSNGAGPFSRPPDQTTSIIKVIDEY